MSRLSIQRDIRRGLRVRMAFLLGGIVLLTLAMIVVTERMTWAGRLQEGASEAATQVAIFLETVRNNLLLLDFEDQDEAAEDLIDGTILKQMFDSMPMIEELVRIDPTGEIEVNLSRGPKNSLAEPFFADADWFTNPNASEVYISALQYGGTGHPTLIVSTRQRTAGNEDVLAVRLSLDALHQITASADIGNTGIAYILTREGVVVEHPHHEHGQHPALGNWDGLPTLLFATTNNAPVAYRNFEGNYVFAAAEAIPGIDWLIVVEVSPIEATYIGQSAFVLLAAISILGWLVVRRFIVNRYETLVLEPVRQLQVGAEKVEQEDLTHRIPVRRNDELGEVSEVFNRMVARLHENNHMVELQTTALTSEILERMKVESALEVMVKDLVDANERALESSRLKSQFLANMSHELRTPLNTVLGYSGIMLDGIAGELDEHARSMLLKIQKSGSALLELINDILDIAKIEAGRLTLVTAPFSIRAAAEEWQAQIEVVAVQKGLAFQRHVSPHVPEWLDGDKVRLSQIVLNLLSNAVKFTKVGSITLNIGWKVDTLEIVVCDTGIGIPPDSLELIFEEFRQVDGSSRREYGGSGLGLAIVRHLCTAMGGTVTVSSEVDKGSTFTVTLPFPVVSLNMLATVFAERGKDV